MTNEEIIAKCKEEIKLRGLSPWTENEYLDKLRVFIRHYQNAPLAEMTEQKIQEFLFYLLDEKKLTSASVNTYNSALRFVFSAVIGRTLNYQMIPRRRVHRELPTIMSKSELINFFSVIDNLRDRAIFETIYGAGLRISEIAHLRV